MSDTDRPKRTGRPPKFPEEGARVQLSVRLKPSTGTALREAAEKNNRSLAEEVEHRVEATFKVGEDVTEALEIAFSARIMKLQRELEAVRTASRSDGYFARLRFAIEKRYALTLERIVFDHQIRISTRLFSFLGNRFQKFASFGRDVAFERVESINMRIKEQNLEIEECKHQIALIRKGMEEEITQARAITEATKTTIADVEERISDAQSRLASSISEVDEQHLASIVTAEPPRANALPRRGRAAERR